MVLDGQLLRRVLVTWLVDAQRPLAVAELVARLDHAGLRVDGRPGKVVSDSLRWEVRRGRVVRVGRGTYVAGSIPRSTARQRRSRRCWKSRGRRTRSLARVLARAVLVRSLRIPSISYRNSGCRRGKRFARRSVRMRTEVRAAVCC